MKNSSIYFLLLSIVITTCLQCSSQVKKEKKDIVVGGPCEGCEAIYESPVEFTDLNFQCRLPDWGEKGKKLIIEGIAYHRNGSPAAGVVLYIYHTNQQGIYAKKGDEKGWGKRHGYIRGWMKTNEKGQYKFYTLMPASYSNSKMPAHIHITIKEPGVTDYYIDEYLFDNDPFLTTEERNKQPGRGGSGILVLEEKEGVLYGERNIYMGRNIPGYPAVN